MLFEILEWIAFPSMVYLTWEVFYGFFAGQWFETDGGMF